MNLQKIIVIKGAGDIASAVAHKLYRSGFLVVMTELEAPTCLRRPVSFANCIYEGEWMVEGVKAVRVHNQEEVLSTLKAGLIPVIVDETCRIKDQIGCNVLIDGILAKKNTGTAIYDAPVVMGLGPGFIAGEDVDIVIETNRGHNLGRIIVEGEAEADTGIPGSIGGMTHERVLRAPLEGNLALIKEIGEMVEAGEGIAVVGEDTIIAPIRGMIRGLLREGHGVKKGMKIGDIDPRGRSEYVYSISDKGRCIAGGVLEAIMIKYNGKDFMWL